MAKNITNQTQPTTRRNFIGENKGLIPDIPEDQLKFTKNPQSINIEIPNALLQNAGLQVALDGVKKLLLLNSLSQGRLSTFARTRAAGGSAKPIGIFMEGAHHYTGGRYYIYYLAAMIAQYYPVVFYTDMLPKFAPDFARYVEGNPNFEIVINDRMNFGHIANFEKRHDVVIGAPRQGGEIAQAYKRVVPHVKCIAVIFETPNYVSAFRDGNDGNEDYWKHYKKVMREADSIIAISNTTKEYAVEWLGEEHRNKFVVIYPNVNHVAIDAVNNNTRLKKFSAKDGKRHIVYVSRMVDFKSPLPVINKLYKDKYVFHLIGKCPSIRKRQLTALQNNGYKIHLYDSVSDAEKFTVIKQCDALMHPSTFEGFGIPPLEAGLLGLPVFAYDIPVFREVYGNNLLYMQQGKEAGFMETMFTKGNLKAKAEAHAAHCAKIGDRRKTAHELLEVIDWPKITTGTIVFNGLDYLPYAIGSIYNYVSEIIIVDGKVQGYTGNHNKGASTDGTVEWIKKFIKEQDIMHKVKFVPAPGKLWPDKVDMQNEIAQRVTGDFYVKVDADEIWKPETLLDVIYTMRGNDKIDIMRMPFYHFWLSFKRIAVDSGGKWSSTHPRVWRWRNEFRHRKSFNYFEIPIGNGKFEKVDAPKYGIDVYNGDRIYHFGYVRTLETLQNKIEYYGTRGIEDPKQVHDTVTNWQPGQATQPTQRKDSTAVDFSGELPDVLKSHPFYNITDIRQEGKDNDEEKRKVDSKRKGNTKSIGERTSSTG